MNLDNIINFFEMLGITMVIDENNKINFYDSQTKEKMDCFCTTNPFHLLTKDDINYDVTLDKLMKGVRVKTASKSKGLCFNLTIPIIDRKRTNDIIIREMEFATAENGIVTNGCRVKFEGGRYPYVSISTTTKNRDVCKTTMWSNGDIEFEKNQNYGYFNESFDEEESYLSKDAMIEVLDNTYLLSEVSDYYSPLFPNMKNSVNKAKQSKEL